VREWAGGRRVSYVTPDSERAELIRLAFSLYATGDYTLEALLEELRARGLTNRGRKDYAAMPITMHSLTWLLTNKFYAGLVEWQGVEYKGLHEQLVDSRTFFKVQDLFASRSGRWTREVRHGHYLKGFLYCAVCGRGLSLQRSKGRYLYFFCLGQKDRRRPTGCKEAYVAAEKLERQVEELYQRVQLPPEWAMRLRSSMEAEIVARQDRNASEREFLTRKLAKVETERRRLLEAYYAGAIDVALLFTEQQRIASDIRRVEERLKNGEATLAEWQEVLAIAFKFAANCGQAYRSANGRTRKLYNSAVFERLDVRNGEVTEVKYREPFGALFVLPEFEQGCVEHNTFAYSNLAAVRTTLAEVARGRPEWLR